VALGGLLCVAALLLAWASSAGLDAERGQAGLESAVTTTPLAFEPSAGRGAEGIDFVAHSVAGGSLFLTSRKAVLSLPQADNGSRELRLGFVGSNPRTRAHGLETLAGETNSFIGDDPSRWRTGIPTYGRVRYERIYPGIDLDFYGSQQDLEYDFRLAAGADPSRIALDVAGTDSLRLAPGGDLLIEVGNTTVRQPAPAAYQRYGDERRRVAAGYELSGSTVSFRLGDYDGSRPLVIDPLVLTYSTYIGGGDEDAFPAIALDSTGAVYLTGDTESANFPVTANRLYPDQAKRDAFVTKFTPTPSGAMTLAYSTYLGASDDDFGRGVAVASTGSVYVTGRTDSTNFPAQDPIAGQTDAGGTDAFVSKLDPAGGGSMVLAYSTYLGGNAFDSGEAIDLDSAGDAYVTGNTDSTDFLIQDQFQSDQGVRDGFVTKLNPDSGGAITPAYSTYLGGAGADSGVDLAVDSVGGVYLTGNTSSATFPVQDPFQAFGGDIDAFATKLNPDPGGANAVTLAYSTFLGGGAFDVGGALAVDASGATYVTGATQSSNFPVQDQLFPDQALQDAFVTKINPDPGGTVTLAYSTYLGASGASEAGNDIVVDSAGAAFVAGNTDSPNFPTKQPIQVDQGAPGDQDGFVAKLDPDSGAAVTLEYSTYLGGAGFDTGSAIAVDSSGVAHVAGFTESTDFPTQDPLQGDQPGRDVFLSTLAVPSAPPAAGGGDAEPPDTTITQRPKDKSKKKAATFAFTATESATFACTLDGRDQFKACTSPITVRVKKGKHHFEVRATDGAGNADATPASDDWKVKKKKK